MKGRSAVLLSRPDRIGDVVLSTSCLRRFASSYSDLPLVPPRSRADARPVRGAPGPRWAVPVPGVDPVGTLAERFHELRIDTLVHLNPHPDVQGRR